MSDRILRPFLASDAAWLVDQQDLYPGSAYYALRPGLTGFWQVSVRHESSFAERAHYDAEWNRR